MPRLVSSETRLPSSTQNYRASHLTRRLLVLLCTLGLILLFLCSRYYLYLDYPSELTSYSAKSSPSLIESSKIYVVSLRRRQDRRADMESLRTSLGLSWDYIDAIESSSGRITAMLRRVRGIRVQHLAANTTLYDLNSTDLPFAWPSNLSDLVSSNISLIAAENAFWESPALEDDSTDLPLLCAQKNFRLSWYWPDLPENKILTLGKLACWDSHLKAISRIAHSQEHEAGLVLEDDIDMESDIRDRLGSIWSFLPHDWDMLFLGHCWSNETFYPPITPPEMQQTRLHPSRSPKCTHGYALSKKGARRLYLHLVHPPFAYSRAIDQAFAWLVKSRRIKSYSLVPSVVVQRKVGGSDVSDGTGSRWRDVLQKGVFRGD